MLHLRFHRVLPLLLVFLATVTVSQEKPGLSVVELLEIPQLSDPRLSPDGSELVYAVAGADWEKNRRVSHIWRQAVGDGSPVQLTRGDGESSPRWSPDGRMIAFLAKRGDDEFAQIYLLPARGGEARRASDHETAPGAIDWAPDSSAIYFLATDAKSEEETKKDELGDDVFAFDENWRHRRLWRLDPVSGEAEPVTTAGSTIGQYRLAADGTSVVLSRSPSPLLDDRWSSELFLETLDGTTSVRLTENSQPESGGELSPDGETVLFLASTNARFEPYYNTNLFLVPSSGGSARLLLESLAHEILAAHWSADSSSIVFLANTGVRSELFRVDIGTETVEPVATGDHALRGWHYEPDTDTHVASVSTSTNAGDVWMLSGTGTARQVTHHFDDLAERYFLPKQEAITWTGADGMEVEGIVYHPRDFREGERYPLVVQTHGGPRASDKLSFGRWGSYVQVLTERGWLVFKPNYRGSTGYGDEHLRDMVGHYFAQSHLDVMTGVDHLIGQGLADGDRMVKMGWSGGGHMTNKIITHTDRFKAASSGAGAANWISMYGQTDIRIHRGNWFGGDPWSEGSDIEKYWATSALSEVWKVKTPTLVLVGQNDERVPAPQSVELYRALRRNGVDTHLYMAPREPHGWRELRHELFKVNVELEWFERHALGRTYEWETAPGDVEPGNESGKSTATASSGDN